LLHFSSIFFYFFAPFENFEIYRPLSWRFVYAWPSMISR